MAGALVMVDSPCLSLAAPASAASLPFLAIRRHHPIGKVVTLLQDQNNKANTLGVCNEEFKLALLQNAQKLAFVQPKAGVSRQNNFFNVPVLVDFQESSNVLVGFMFGLAQHYSQYEKIIPLLTSGSNRRLDEILDVSLLSNLMGIQCLASKDNEYCFSSKIDFLLYGDENIAPDEFRKDIMKFRECFQTHQKLCSHNRTYTEYRESVPQFLQSNAAVMGWVEPEAHVFLFPGTKNKKQDSVANISERLVKNQIKLDKQFAFVPHFENSLLDIPSINYEEKSPENLYETIKFDEQKIPLPDRVKSSVASPAKLKPKHHARKKNKKLVKQQRDIFQKSQFHHYEYMLSMLFNNDSATSSASQLKKINQKEFTMLLNQISVGLTGSGLGITLFVASRVLTVNAFDSRRLTNIMFGIGLLWLSAGVQNLREVVLSITRLSDKLKREERKIISKLKWELTGVFFKAFTLIAFSLVRFV